MSSILEALKELESDKARATKKATSVADVPSTPPRSLAPLFAVGGCLAIAVIAFGVHRWTSSARDERPVEPAAPEVAARAAAEPAPAPTRGPGWLQRAEAPRARVAPPPSVPPAPLAAAPAPTEHAAVPVATEPVAAQRAPARTAPEQPVAAAVAPPAAPPPARPAPGQAAPVQAAAPAPPAPKPAPSRAVSGGIQQVQMEALSFSSHVAQRTVTLLVNGSRATLHQGESLGGVDVQLIMADGAYLQRGSDVFFIGKPR